MRSSPVVIKREFIPDSLIRYVIIPDAQCRALTWYFNLTSTRDTLALRRLLESRLTIRYFDGANWSTGFCISI